ncbi:MAG: cysteine desulfurase NifS, cysteine desulfurase [Candidatus Dadabacteria bacterium CSP1-2]|nr:MAG: cysteine desulfurase NifS, cysteine desulfurase [Candidatus Dadabacteria bacterium CSP1-2]
MKKVYLDYNATTPIDPRVFEAMIPYMKEEFGNPSSIHSYGRAGKAALDNSREQIAELLGARPKEIVFTSGGSESNNFAIKGIAFLLREKGNHLITTQVEHASVLETFGFLESQGFRVTYLGVDKYGLIDFGELREAITDDTILVSVMFANNETGVIMPIEEIAGIVKEKGVIFHTDAIQAVGKLDINLKNLPVDLLSLSGHKLYGPKGVGALFVRTGVGARHGVSLQPLIHGGGQERGKRSGTENVAGIVGFGKACEIFKEDAGYKMRDARIKELRDELYEGISERISGLKLNGHPEKRLSNTLNLSFEGVEGESLVMNLDIEGIAVSTGSACSEGNVEPSHVLLAMGLSKEQAVSSLRFSLGRFTEKEDINRVTQVIPGIVERIREISSSDKGNLPQSAQWVS